MKDQNPGNDVKSKVEVSSSDKAPIPKKNVQPPKIEDKPILV